MISVSFGGVRPLRSEPVASIVKRYFNQELWPFRREQALVAIVIGSIFPDADGQLARRVFAFRRGYSFSKGMLFYGIRVASCGQLKWIDPVGFEIDAKCEAVCLNMPFNSRQEFSLIVGHSARRFDRLFRSVEALVVGAFNEHST